MLRQRQVGVGVGVDKDVTLRLEPLAPIGRDDHSAKAHDALLELGKTRDRSLARPVEGREKGALAGDCLRRGGIVKRGKQRLGAFIVAAARHANGALTTRRAHFHGGENLGCVPGKTKPFEPGQREKRGIGLSLVEFPQPRLDIAAEIDNAEIGTAPPHLCRPAQG